MPQQILSINDIKRDRRGQPKRTISHDYTLHGRPYRLDIEFVQGEIQNRPLFPTGQHHILKKYVGAVNYGGGQPVAGELLTTPANLQAFIQKTIVDLQIGLEDVPLLYEPIYRRISDGNLTENVDVRAIVSRANVVFFSHIEGEEIKFGSRMLGPLQTVPLVTWAGAFEWTEDLVEYDKTWEVQQINEGFGRAYNALLNHIHLSPILNPLGPDGQPIPYPPKNSTAAATEADVGTSEYRVRLRRTIQNGMQASEADRQTDTGMGRYPTILLAHPSRRFDFEDALGRFTLNGTEYPSLSAPDTLIFYAGYSVRVGDKTFIYDGVDPNLFFLIDPTTYFIELIKHDLRVDATQGDLSRLIVQQVVARTRRGVFAAPFEAVQVCQMP